MFSIFISSCLTPLYQLPFSEILISDGLDGKEIISYINFNILNSSLPQFYHPREGDKIGWSGGRHGGKEADVPIYRAPAGAEAKITL